MEDERKVSALSTDRLLLVTHVALKRGPEGYCIDDQTAQGLIRWCENFEQVTYTGIDISDADLAENASVAWVAIDSLPCADRINVIALPRAYRIGEFTSDYKKIRKVLAAEIARSRYLCYTLGTLFGDWGGVAALESIKQGRSYAAWFDFIGHEVIRSDLPSMPLKRRIKQALSIPFIRHYHHYLTRRSGLGLFQGMDCYNYYHNLTDNAFCMYDTHTLESDFIDADRLEEKISAVGAMAPLQICYAGRAADMKGPLDWLEVLALLRDEGVRFHATWLGDGPMLDRMRAVVEQRSLSANIDLAGFVSDRAKLLDRMKSSHIFLFCHKTPESPRCLIESLVCGTPIVGYGSAYARDIVAEHGGGQFADVGNVRQLADRLIALDRDRGALQAEIRRAARSGLRYDEQSLYRERARHIRAHL